MDCSFVKASRAYRALYDFGTGLWAQGPDCFAESVMRSFFGGGIGPTQTASERFHDVLKESV